MLQVFGLSNEDLVIRLIAIADLPAPEALKPVDVKDAQPLIDLLGDYTARALFSKSWQLREAALQASCIWT